MTFRESRGWPIAAVVLAGAIVASPARAADAPSVRLPADLPLRRDVGPAMGSGHPGRAGAVLLVLLALAGAAILHGRKRLLPSGSTGERKLATWLRGWAPAAPGDRLRVLQSVRLTSRASVHVVRWDGKEWLVGCGDQGVSVLGQRPALDRPSESASSGAPATREHSIGEEP
jgi:hypothetical protein